MILAAIPSIIGGVIAFIKNTSPWQFALVEAACIVIPMTAIVVFFRPKNYGARAAPVASQPPPDPAASKLQFGEFNQVDIGPGIGNQAALIAIHNVENRYDYRCHGIKAELTFTHPHSKETFKLKGWFASINNIGRIVEKPVDSLTLDSRSRKHAWLILYVRSYAEKGQYRFVEPGPAVEVVPVSDWTPNLNGSNRLSFGEWQIKIAITSDGDDKLQRLHQFHAE